MMTGKTTTIANEFNMKNMQRDRRDSCLPPLLTLGVHDTVLSPEPTPDKEQQNGHDC